MNDRQTKEFDATKDATSRSRRGHRAVPRQRVRADGLTGAVLRTINVKVPTHRRPRAAPILKEIVLSKWWPLHPGGRTVRQVDLARRDAGLPQRQDPRHNHHDRDPIEYVHTHKNCVVTQREVGVDTDSWHMALKNTLRQAPDVILIGENPRPRHDGVRDPVRRETATLCSPRCTPTAATRRWTASSTSSRGPARAAADGPLAHIRAMVGSG